MKPTFQLLGKTSHLRNCFALGVVVGFQRSQTASTCGFRSITCEEGKALQLVNSSSTAALYTCKRGIIGSTSTGNGKTESEESNAQQPKEESSASSASQDNSVKPGSAEEVSQPKDSETSGEKSEPEGSGSNVAVGNHGGTDSKSVAEKEPEPERWIQPDYVDPDTAPIVNEKGEYIVSKGNWPTGEVAYATPAPPDRLAPRFGYNVVQVKKPETWWQHYRKFPRVSIAYINIQVIFLLGLAWLMAFINTEHRITMEEMKRPGAMVGDYRGRGPVTNKTQKIEFTPSEMNDLMTRAQDNWLDAKTETSYIGSKDYQMKKIPRPKEFSVDDIRKR